MGTLSDTDRSELFDNPDQPQLIAPDLLVLGGGIVGLATAYFAAECGLRVQVIAPSRLAADAELSLGCIIPNASSWQFPAVCQPLAQASRDWWAKLAVRPEFRLDWRVAGALMVDPVRLAPSPRHHMLAALDEGYSVHEVDAEQIALLEPALAPCPLGGLHYPSEAVLNPLQAACGFARGLRRRGGQISGANSIQQARVSAGRFSMIEASTIEIQPKVVFADDIGLLQSVLSEQPPVEPLLQTSRRVFLASSPQPPLLKRPVLDSNWVVQLKTGEIVTESSVVGDDQQDQILTQLRQSIPAVQDVEFLHRWVGESQHLPDQIPVVDKVTGLENVWYCGALDFAAVMFAPIIGKLVVDWIQKDQRPEEFAAFSSARGT